MDLMEQNSYTNFSDDQSLFLETNFSTVVKEYINFRKNHLGFFLFTLIMFLIFSFGFDIFSFGGNIFSLSIVSIKTEYIDIPMFVIFILGALTWYKFVKIKRNQTFRLLVEMEYYDFQFQQFDIFYFGSISSKHKKYERLLISTYGKEDGSGSTSIRFKIIFEISIDRCQPDIKSNVSNNIAVNIHGDYYTISATTEYKFDKLRERINVLENFIHTSLIT